MHDREKIVAAICDSLSKGAGLLQSCEAAGISSMTLYRWKQDDPQIRAAIDEAQESLVDRIENALYEDALTPGNNEAKKFVLKNRRAGKWKERNDLFVDGAPGLINLMPPDAAAPAEPPPA